MLRSLREIRGWHRRHEQAWVGQATIGAQDLSRFQVECEERVVEHLQKLGRGVRERHCEDSVVWIDLTRSSDSTVFISADGAQLDRSEGGSEFFESGGYLSPLDLIQDLLARITVVTDSIGDPPDPT